MIVFQSLLKKLLWHIARGERGGVSEERRVHIVSCTFIHTSRCVFLPWQALLTLSRNFRRRTYLDDKHLGVQIPPPRAPKRPKKQGAKTDPFSHTYVSAPTSPTTATKRTSAVAFAQDGQHAERGGDSCVEGEWSEEAELAIQEIEEHIGRSADRLGGYLRLFDDSRPRYGPNTSWSKYASKPQKPRQGGEKRTRSNLDAL